MRRKRWVIPVAWLVCSTMIATAVYAGLTGVTVTPNPVVIGNPINWQADDDNDPPSNAGNTAWTYVCPGCPAGPWGAFGCIYFVDSFPLTATQNWVVPDPNNPYGVGIAKTSVATTNVSVIQADMITTSFPNGQSGRYQGT